MKLFVPILVVLATWAAAASAQEYAHPVAQAGAARIGSGTLDELQNGKVPSETEMPALPAQLQAEEQSLLAATSQTGCPVILTSAHLNWPASYLPVTSAEKVTEPSLALGFENSSGRPIRSVTIEARFLGKQNIYRLDAAAFDLRLTFSGVDAANNAADQLREIRVPNRMYAYGVTRVSLEQVLFADGTFWTAFGHRNCALDVQGSASRVAK